MTTQVTKIGAAVRTLIEEDRQRIGDPPSVDELMAYHRGELSDQEADRMQERLAHYPDSVRLLDALASYPYEGEPGDPDYLSDEELEHAWLAVQDHLHYEAPVVPFRKKAVPASKASSFNTRRFMAIAASVVAMAGGAWFLHQWQVDEVTSALRSPSTDIESQLAIPDGFRTARGGTPSIQLPSGADSYYLSLAVIDAPHYRDYRLDILDPATPEAAPLWSRTGLQRQHDDTFELLLRRSFLTVRKIELRLYGLDDQGTWQPLATYTVEL